MIMVEASSLPTCDWIPMERDETLGNKPEQGKLIWVIFRIDSSLKVDYPQIIATKAE
jgi:hypothetical protein